MLESRVIVLDEVKMVGKIMWKMKQCIIQFPHYHLKKKVFLFVLFEFCPETNQHQEKNQDQPKAAQQPCIKTYLFYSTGIINK